MSAEADGFLSRWSRRKVSVRQGVALPEPAAIETPAAANAAATGAATPAATALKPVPASASAPAPTASAALPTAQAPAAGAEPLAAEPAPPAPTMADVATLTRDSDYARFMAPGVDSGVKNAALKKLFTDPHFNVMDRLDTYIDDYNTPDPLPAGMLRKMAQAQFLGLFAEEDAAKDAAENAAAEAARLAALRTELTQRGESPLPLPLPDSAAPPNSAKLTSDEDADLRLQPHDAAGPPGADPGPGPNAGRQH